MEFNHKSDDEIQEISSPEEDIQLSAAEESTIAECLTDPEGSLSSVDLNLFTDGPTNAGKTKKSMAKRREERRNFKFLTAASQSEDEEDSQQSSSLSSISLIDSSFIDKQNLPTVNTIKTLEDYEPRFNVIPKTTEDHFKGIPSRASTSKDTNVITVNEKKVTKITKLIDSNEERTNSVALTGATVPGLHQLPLQEIGIKLIASPSSIDRSDLVRKGPIKCNLETWTSKTIQSALKVPEGKQPMNIELLNIELFQSGCAPSTSKDNSKDVGIIKNAQVSTPGIPSIGKTYFEEKDQMSDKKNQVDTWVQNNFNNETEFDENNVSEDGVENESNNILNSVAATSNSVVTKASVMTNDEEFDDSLEQLIRKNDNLLRQERKRNRSHSDRDPFSVSSPKKKIRRRKRTKNPENHHIYTFFSSMADLVSTFSYNSTLAAKSKMTEVLKEMEKELIEWHKDPSTDKKMADFKMSEEDLKLISKKLAYLPYVY